MGIPVHLMRIPVHFMRIFEAVTRWVYYDFE